MLQLFGRKPRSARAASVKHVAHGVRLVDALRDRSVLLRLGITLLGIIGFLFAVRAWQPLFPYRVGDRLSRGVVARVDFQEVNQTETERAQQDREALVPYVFQHDPNPLTALPARLRNHLGAIVQAENLDQVPPEVRAAFELNSPATPDPEAKTAASNSGEKQAAPVITASLSEEPGSKGAGTGAEITDQDQTAPDGDEAIVAPRGPHPPSTSGPIPARAVSRTEPPQNQTKRRPPPEKRFEALRTALQGTEAVGQELDQIQKDFEEFLGPLRAYGVLDLDEVSREELIAKRNGQVPLDHAVEIVTGDESQLATIADVVLEVTMRDTGRLGNRLLSFARLSAIRDDLEIWMTSQVPRTLHFDAGTTQENRRVAREAVGIRYDSYTAGTTLINPGAILDDELVRRLRLEYDAVTEATPVGNRILRVCTAFMMFTVLAVLFASYLVRSEPQVVASSTQLAVFVTLSVATVWLARLLSLDPWRAEVIPLLATVMILSIAYDQVLATLSAFVLSVVISLSTVATLEHFMVLMVVSVVSIVPLSSTSSRSSMVKTGFLVAAVYFAVTWAVGVIGPDIDVHWADSTLLMNALRGAGWCLMCCYLVSGSMPFIESRFGIVTDMSLLELSDISHPLLQELVRRAPGTYNHSIAVATIGEAAAESIGCNGLLVRVGAYFHDIGKMLKPEYFIENNTAGEGNRHETLAPAMSTLIIIGHVKDGVELAHEHNLPRPIIDFIEQHHGTTLVEYFYHEAARQADEDHKSEAEESSYRYPGPKPQTKEAGIMMLADAVESASRTLSEPTPKRIENLVHEIAMKRLLDNQFDESSLTLSEIHTVEESLIKSLIAVHHGRVKYPEQRSA